VYYTVFIGIRQRQKSTIPKRKKKKNKKNFWCNLRAKHCLAYALRYKIVISSGETTTYSDFRGGDFFGLSPCPIRG